MNLCSHHVSNCPVYPRARRGEVVGGRWRSRNVQDPQRLRSVLLFDNLHLENSFKNNGVGGQQVLDLLALEDDVFQRCLSAHPDPTALQRSNRGKFAHLLRDLDATADTPHHCPLFALQLLDLTHRRWSESQGPDIEEGDVYSLLALKLHSVRNPDLTPFQLSDPRQPARSVTDLLTALAATLGKRQPRNVPPLHTAQAVHEVVVEEHCILDSVNFELATYTLTDWVRRDPLFLEG